MKTAEQVLDKANWFPSKGINPTQRIIILNAMEAYAKQFQSAPLPDITDEEIEDENKRLYYLDYNCMDESESYGFERGAKWYRSQIKLKIADR